MTDTTREARYQRLMVDRDSPAPGGRVCVWVPEVFPREDRKCRDIDGRDIDDGKCWKYLVLLLTEDQAAGLIDELLRAGVPGEFDLRQAPKKAEPAFDLEAELVPAKALEFVNNLLEMGMQVTITRSGNAHRIRAMKEAL